MPLLFGAGEAFQFDWSEDWAIIGGERTKLHVAHFKLSHSRAFIVRAYRCRVSGWPSHIDSPEGDRSSRTSFRRFLMTVSVVGHG